MQAWSTPPQGDRGVGDEVVVDEGVQGGPQSRHSGAPARQQRPQQLLPLPGQQALGPLQETRLPGCVPCRVHNALRFLHKLQAAACLSRSNRCSVPLESDG